MMTSRRVAVDPLMTMNRAHHQGVSQLKFYLIHHFRNVFILMLRMNKEEISAGK